MRFLKVAFLALIFTVVLAGCNRAPSNVITMQTSDCGRTWRTIGVGQTIPNQPMTVCGYNIQLPNYPMQGSTEFLTQFKDNVLVKVQISYDYTIVDGAKYLNFAKFLGRMRTETTGGEEANADNNGTSKYESAENVVIDNRIREQVTSDTPVEDIVTFNPTKFEAGLYKRANDIMAERGVQLSNMTFVVLPEDQTRMAIDAATAMAVYESKGMAELGRELVVARAGASQVTVHSK